jgi:general secretion pathway protein C
MKRMPLVVTVLAVALLSASLAYWVLQLNQPPQRAIAAPPPAAAAVLNLDAAKGLFGGQITVAAASNYQLKGVVAAGGRGSAAILAVDNQPAQAYGLGREVAPGVVVKEVQPRFVLLSEGGAIKRVDLPSDAGVSSTAPAQPAIRPAVQPTAPPAPAMPAPQVQMQPAPAMQPAGTVPPAAGQQNPRPPNAPNNPNAIGPVPGFDRQQ